MVRGSRRFCLIVASFLRLVCSALPRAVPAATFATWDTLEADKCDSIWLIKRFIDPDAEFRFHANGQTIAEGIAFDTPDARFRRYPHKSTFERLVDAYGLTGRGVEYIARLTHDIEINVWQRKRVPESLQVAADINEIASESGPEAFVEACVSYFDAFHARHQ